jgi:hypothetical protein
MPTTAGDPIPAGCTRAGGGSGPEPDPPGNNYVNVDASSNGALGIVIDTGSTATHIDGSTANGNGDIGIVIAVGATGNAVHGNTALGNGLFDLDDDNPGCDNNNWEGNHFVTANQPCIS